MRSAPLVLTILAASAAHAAEWHTLTPDGEPFTVEMPAEPKIEVTDLLDNPAAPAMTKTYSAETPEGWAYIVACTSAPDASQTPQSDARKALDSIREGVLAGTNDKLISKTDLIIDGYAAQEFFAAQADSFSTAARIAIVGNKMCQALAAVSKDGLDSAEVRRFLDSFHFTRAK